MTHATEVKPTSRQRKKIDELKRGSEFEDLDKFCEQARTETGCENKSADLLQNGKVQDDRTYKNSSPENQIEKNETQEPIMDPLTQISNGISTMAHQISGFHEDMFIDSSSLLANASLEASSYGFLDNGNRSNSLVIDQTSKAEAESLESSFDCITDIFIDPELPNCSEITVGGSNEATANKDFVANSLSPNNNISVETRINSDTRNDFKSGKTTTDNEHGAAVWDIFRREDVPMLTEYLLKHQMEFCHRNSSVKDSVSARSNIHDLDQKVIVLTWVLLSI